MNFPDFIDKAYCDLGRDGLSLLKRGSPGKKSLGNTGLNGSFNIFGNAHLLSCQEN